MKTLKVGTKRKKNNSFPKNKTIKLGKGVDENLNLKEKDEKNINYVFIEHCLS